MYICIYVYMYIGIYVYRYICMFYLALLRKTGWAKAQQARQQCGPNLMRRGSSMPQRPSTLRLSSWRPVYAGL